MVKPGYSWKMNGEKVFGHPFARVETETYEGFDAISWVLHFTGDGQTRIADLLDCDVELPLPQAEERTPGCVYRYGHTRIDTMSGCSGDWYGRDYNQQATDASGCLNRHAPVEVPVRFRYQDTACQNTLLSVV